MYIINNNIGRYILDLYFILAFSPLSLTSPTPSPSYGFGDGLQS